MSRVSPGAVGCVPRESEVERERERERARWPRGKGRERKEARRGKEGEVSKQAGK